jgi:hypothetical protein
MSRAVSTFDRVVSPGSIAALEAELETDKNRFSEGLEEFGRLREELESLSASIGRQEKVIEAIRSALSPDGNQSSLDSRHTGDAPRSKREIATEILDGSIQPLFPREVRKIAIERGWLPADRAAANQLSVAMAKGARAGFFLRDRKGRYRLPGTND